MKVALVALGDQAPGCGLDHVDRLADGLVRRGAEVEVVALGDPRRQRVFQSAFGRRIPSGVRRFRFAVPSAFWRAIGLGAAGADIVDIHISEPPMAPIGPPAAIGPMVLTLHTPVERLRRWPYSRAVAALLDGSARVLCGSRVEHNLLCKAFPHAAGRTEILAPGVDERAILTAVPFSSGHVIVLAAGRLERKRRVDRAIAAMPSLEPRFRLVILGEGPDRRRLEAYAADLQVASRVTFAGAAPDALYHRWLRTARVFAALSGEENSGVHIIEALAAGASVVASDIPVHQEAVQQVPRARAFFVPPDGSPLDVADAIELAEHRAAPLAVGCAPSWETVVDATWEIYRQVALGAPRVRYIDYPRSVAS
jgi:glycosyltransferase involved in cell wall biosynthesis